MAGIVAKEGARIESGPDGNGWRIGVAGRWTLDVAGPAGEALDGMPQPAEETAVRLDLTDVDALDTVGAYLINRLAEGLRAGGHTVETIGLRPEQAALFAAVHDACKVPPRPIEREHHPVIDMVVRTGETTVTAGKELLNLVGFLGLVTVTFARLVVRPSRLRLTSVLFHIEQTGLNALPILGLLSFLIGVVLAFQGADQLKRFGAELFVVNLLGISVLREIGILMTAIIVAGRSGSAFTAQIGTMKVNQEVDAIGTMGLDPVELLVVPRALALMITLPLLAFYADIMGLFGGAVMAYATLDITFGQFIRQLHTAVGINTVLTGLVKAPVFALVIAMVGCYEGLKVSGSAESVGIMTTRAVVEGIFLVIVIDAVFSILFSMLGV
ncbi:ABC transporter permease [Azospirillum picis]|uniref:Phospholipid/cholesterol/gamma-HCH transport system permease protein n=1 Tax=Azospirillum picis TaxID=488438 RepID=A0ABU0MPI4_9PROT|nr:MlaE family lipid ABC transporter permease subunit [Azospirillum picis]MBP2301403.1 phospholipid/cholesterol/gamma-HCH transport system permease protein [Azospirillum picis]MDQ0535234.1 phospholipid/cholesterol/gamma-HCH transport system permease protein [Azospirillum picis]